MKTKTYCEENQGVDLIPLERANTVGLTCWLDFRNGDLLRAVVKDIALCCIHPNFPPSMVYVTEGDFSGYIENLYGKPAYRKNGSREFKPVNLTGMIGTQEEYKSFLERLRLNPRFVKHATIQLGHTWKNPGSVEEFKDPMIKDCLVPTKIYGRTVAIEEGFERIMDLVVLSKESQFINLTIIDPREHLPGYYDHTDSMPIDLNKVIEGMLALGLEKCPAEVALLLSFNEANNLRYYAQNLVVAMDSLTDGKMIPARFILRGRELGSICSCCPHNIFNLLFVLPGND